jgi:transcription elongation GreA/GreB family factor
MLWGRSIGRNQSVSLCWEDQLDLQTFNNKLRGVLEAQARRPIVSPPAIVPGVTLDLRIKKGRAPIKDGTIRIVEDGKGNPDADPPMLSCNTPIARALRAADVEVGDIVDLEVNGRTFTIEILGIKPRTTN